MKAVYAVLQNGKSRKILQALADSDQQEVTNGNLSDRTHLPRSTISESITQLSGVSLVKRSFTLDGHTLYEVQDREEVLRLLTFFQKDILKVAANGFIDLWDL